MGGSGKAGAEWWPLCESGSRREARWSVRKATISRGGMGRRRAAKGARGRSGGIWRSVEVLRRLVTTWGESSLRWPLLWRVLGLILRTRRTRVWRIVWLLVRCRRLRAVLLRKRSVARSWWSAICCLRRGVRRTILWIYCQQVKT